MKIQVLGSGCDKCKKLADNVQEAVAKVGLDCEIEKVTDINRITGFGVMMTPALVVDGKVVSSGKVLSPEEIAEFLKPAPCSCGGACEAKPEKKEEKTDSCGCNASPETESSCGCGTETPSCPFCGNKKVFTRFLLLFVIGSIAFMIFKEVKEKKAAVPAENAPALQTAVKKGAVMVYYFHGNQRCMTCNRIEALTKQTLQDKFAKQLADGNLVFRSVNLDNPADEHFIQDFQLTTRSVVMQKNGKFEKFDQVWNLVGDPAKFTGYIQSGVEKMLK